MGRTACTELQCLYKGCTLRAGWLGDRIPVGARFSVPVQTGPGAHPASCTVGTGSFPGVKSGRGVTLTPHHLLVPWSRKGRAIPLLPLWAVRPVQSLSACTRVHFTDWTVRGSNPGGGEIFHTCPDRPWGPPSLLYNGYLVFPGGKERSGRDADPSPPSTFMKE